jgi:3-hydroxybutyryl-CoA dehydratase
MKYFEDFVPGETYHSRGRTVTETDIVNFAGISGDFFPLHVDEEFAKTTPFGRRVAHGALVFSISTGLSTQMSLITDSLIALYSIEKMRFTNPVFAGDTIRLSRKVTETLERGADRGVVTFSVTVRNQRDEPVLIFSDRLVIRRKPGAEPATQANA